MLSEAVSESLNDGVAASGGEGRHVKDGADGFSPTADGSFTLVGAAIAIEGGQSDQGGDLLSIELTEFGDLREEGRGSDATEPRHGLHELSLLAPIIVGFDEGFDGGFDLADLAVEESQDGLDAFSDAFGADDLEAIGLHGPQVNKLSSAGDELLDFGLLFRGFMGWRRLDLLGEKGQDASIDAVGLGDQAEGLGEISGPFGIDHGDVMSLVEQVGNELSLIAAGGFENDAAGGWVGEQLFKLPMTCGVVRQRVFLTGGKEVEVERGLGDVDSNPSEVRAIHGSVPFLPMRARGRLGGLAAPATVRVRFQRPATIQLCDGVVGT
jgi:hypothetical protein